MAVKTYAPCLMKIVVRGKTIDGFSEGDLVTITPDSDKFTKKVGATGEVARAANCTDAGKIKFTLLQTSDANDYFSELLLNDSRSVTGEDIVSIYISDLNGTSEYAVAEAWLMKWPEASYKNEVENREWEFDCADIDWYVGGNRAQPNLEGFEGGIGANIEATLGGSITINA